jgi:integrase
VAVFKVKKSGKWAVDWYDPKRHRREFDRKGDADAFEATIRTEKQKGTYMPIEKIPTFADVSASLLASKESLRPGTWRNVDIILRQHLLPKWGALRLDYVTVPDIETWMRELIERRSTGTLRNIMTVAGEVYDEAIRHGQWSRPNPFRVAKRPVKQVEAIADPEASVDDDEDGERAITEAEVFTAPQVRSLIDHADDDMRLLVETAAQTGMRQGELLALRWSRIDFKADGTGEIRVEHSLSWAKGPGDAKPTPRLYPPKTKAGKRTIPLTRSLVTALKAHKLSHPGEIVFSNGGDYERPERALRAVKRAKRKARNLPDLSFHALRHFFCSSLLGHGKNPLEVQKLAGHKDVSVTLKVYSHWIQNGKSEALDLLGAAGSEQIVSDAQGEVVDFAIKA